MLRPRLRPLALLAVALTVLGGPVRAHAGEAPPPPQAAPGEPGAEEVAALARGLRDGDAAQRGAALARLEAALAATADRRALLRRLAEALARVADERPAPAPAPAAQEAPTPAPPAPTTPSAPPTPTTPVAPAPQAAVAPPPAPEPPPTSEPAGQSEAEAPAPRLRLRAWGASLPAAEVGPLLAALDAQGATGGARDDDGRRSRTGPASAAEGWARAALQRPDAQTLGEGTLALPEGLDARLHLGTALSYRCCITPSPGGAWAVSTATLPAGLSLEARLGPEGLDLAAVWLSVAAPMATTRERPAANVDPVELDRPDWSLARARRRGPAAPEGWTLLAVEPRLLPESGRVLVLVVEGVPVR